MSRQPKRRSTQRNSARPLIPTNSTCKSQIGLASDCPEAVRDENIRSRVPWPWD